MIGTKPPWGHVPAVHLQGLLTTETSTGDHILQAISGDLRSGATPDQMLRAAATAPGAQLAAQRIQRQKPLPLPCLDPIQFMTVNNVVNFVGVFCSTKI